MATASINSDLFLAGTLRRARQMPDPLAWLNERHNAAYDAVMAGDEYVTSTSNESGTNTAERNIPAAVLQPLYELAIQRYEADEAAGTTQFINGGTDFSQGFTRC